MKRWQRLGIFPHKSDYFPGYVRNMEMSMAELQQYERDDDQRSRRVYDICDCVATALLAHFEYDDHPFGDVSQYGRKAAEIAVDFFYGNWRKGYWYDIGQTLTIEQCRKKLDWFVEYRRGLMWSLILDEEELLARLLQWPDTDLPPQEEISGVSRGDVDYHIVLAGYLRGKPTFEDDELLKKVRRRKRHKMLLAALECIHETDAKAFGESLEKVVDEFLISSDLGQPYIDYFISIEGTILWHVARRVGIELPMLEQRLMDLIVTKESMRCS